MKDDVREHWQFVPQVETEISMTKEITTSAFGTVPVVVFQRLHVDTKEPISVHAIIFADAQDAKDKANWINRQSHLALVGITDATFHE